MISVSSLPIVVTRVWFIIAGFAFLFDKDSLIIALGWVSTNRSSAPLPSSIRNPHHRCGQRHQFLLSSRRATPSTTTPMILLVDDEEGIRNAVGELLQENGFTVTLCADATSAMEQLQSSQNARGSSSTFDCIVSDIRMPGPSGLDFVQTLRKIEALRTIPVVLLTAAGRPNDRIAGYQAGADAYLPKPFDPDELVAILRRLIDRRISMADIQTELVAISQALKQQGSNVYLVPDEALVLTYVCEGWTTKEIAAKMFLSTGRIDQILTLLFRKAKVKNRTELIRWAVATGTVKL